MNRIVVFVLMFVSLSATINKDNPVVQRAKDFAEEYYSSFQQLAQMSDPYTDEGIRLEAKIMNLAGSDHNDHELLYGFRVSNDIDPVLGSVNTGKSDLSFSSYVGHYKDYVARYKGFGFSYKVLSCEPLEAPSMKGVESDAFAKVVVRKTLSRANKFIDIDETMTISFTRNSSSLSSISNSYGTEQSAGDLFAQALEHYSKHQYKEALSMFEKQIELFDDPKAYYYAAIMYYKNQGCRGMGYSKRYEKFVQGMRIAAQAGNQRAQFTLSREGIE